MALFTETLQTASFGGTAFPVLRCTVTGGVRDHTHEFPHSPGGENEKLGRKLYIVTMTIPAHDLPDTDLDIKYPNLRNRIAMLHEMWELQKTEDLVVPMRGTIPAYATTWEEKLDPSLTESGTVIEVSFKEDQETDSLGAAIPAQGIARVASSNDDLQAAAALADFNKESTLSVFQQINDLVTSIQALSGIEDAFSQVLESKLDSLIQLCGDADRSAVELQDPSNYAAIEALKNVWAAATDLAANVTNNAPRLLDYIVPQTMPITKVAVNIYGSSERSEELLQLNAVDDPLEVRAGTTIRYVEAT